MPYIKFLDNISFEELTFIDEYSIEEFKDLLSDYGQHTTNDVWLKCLHDSSRANFDAFCFHSFKENTVIIFDKNNKRLAPHTEGVILNSLIIPKRLFINLGVEKIITGIFEKDSELISKIPNIDYRCLELKIVENKDFIDQMAFGIAVATGI